MRKPCPHCAGEWALREDGGGRVTISHSLPVCTRFDELMAEVPEPGPSSVEVLDSRGEPRRRWEA